MAVHCDEIGKWLTYYNFRIFYEIKSVANGYSIRKTRKLNGYCKPNDESIIASIKSLLTKEKKIFWEKIF
jgi:hypothetical protein